MAFLALLRKLVALLALLKKVALLALLINWGESTCLEYAGGRLIGIKRVPGVFSYTGCLLK